MKALTRSWRQLIHKKFIASHKAKYIVMKKIVLAVALLIAGSSVYAQDTKTLVEEPKQTLERMDKAVKLSESQKTQLTDLYTTTQARINIVMNEGPADNIDKGLEEIIKNKEAATKSILTEEQYRKWTAANTSK